MLENVEEIRKSSGECEERQKILVESIDVLLKIALDGNEIRKQIALIEEKLSQHNERIIDHDEKIASLVGEAFTIARTVEKFIEEMRASQLTDDDKKTLVEVLKSYRKGSEKITLAVKYYLTVSIPLFIAVAAGVNVKEKIGAIVKNIFMMII